MFPALSAAERTRHVGESCRLTIAACLVRSSGRILLVDTGIGPVGNPRFGIAPGTLLDQLAGLGVRPEAVDTVVLTHLHADHIGWNTTARDGGRVPTFPHARYVIHADELAYWQNSARWRHTPIEAQVLPLAQAGVLDTYDGEHRLTAELTLVPTPGHTPGHTTVAIASGGAYGFILGDVAHHPAQVAAPAHRSAFDVDPAQAAVTRRQLFDRAVALDGLLIAGHFPPPGVGRIASTGGRRT